MRSIRNFTFAAMALIAVALFFQPSVALANGQQDDDHDKGDRGHRNSKATINFTKWVTAIPNQPGLIATMTGVGDGDAGEGIFSGDLLKSSPLPPAGRVAVYNFVGSKHSFTALIHGFQAVPGIGEKGVIVGAVIDGWLKGRALEGEWTEIPSCFEPGTGFGNCYAVTLKIDKDND